MRFVNIYLTVYFVLIAGAVIALWSGGALGAIPPVWTVISLLIAVGFGVLLALATRPITEE